MVSRYKDDPESKATPVMNRIPNTVTRTAKQAPRHFITSVGREKSQQPMAHRDIQFGYCFLAA